MKCGRHDHSIDFKKCTCNVRGRKKHWNPTDPGTRQLQATQTIIRNNYTDDTQFYYELQISILFPQKYF